MSAPTVRRTPARWRKSKGQHWGKWELWRGEAWLAGITEVRIRAGGCKYIWILVNRATSGHTDDLAAAKTAARHALEHAEIEESIAEMAREAEHGGGPS